MKTLILSLLFISICSLSALAQNTEKDNRADFPADLRGASDSLELLNNPTFKTRLEKLLGKENYDSFLESFETVAPIKKSKSFLFASGCLIHACSQLESAIAVNLVSKTVHAAIYRRGEKTRFFNEKGRATPTNINNWANRLQK